MRTVLLSLAFVLAAVSPAGAQTFDSAASDATSVYDLGDLAALFWSQDAACEKRESDLARRQCEAIRKARSAQIASTTYLVQGQGNPVSVAKPSAKAKALTLDITSCIACGDDADVIVVGGRTRGRKANLSAPTLKKVAWPVEDADAAEHFRAYVAPRLRSEFLVKVAGKGAGKTKAAGDKDVYVVNVVGYRVYDPCRGTVIASQPSSERGPRLLIDKRNEPVEKKIVEAPKPKKPEGPESRRPAQHRADQRRPQSRPRSRRRLLSGLRHRRHGQLPHHHRRRWQRGRGRPKRRLRRHPHRRVHRRSRQSRALPGLKKETNPNQLPPDSALSTRRGT